MCGQAGVSGSISVASEKAFQRLLIYNSVRGIDSTGAASVKRALNKKEIEIVVAKELGNPFNLLGVRRQSEHDFSDVMAATSRVLLGHCRSATKGETSRFNAHPFCFDNVVGTHNGTLSFTSHGKLTGQAKFQTDSEAIFAEIEAFGIAPTVKKFKGYHDNDKFSCSDAYALVWYDIRDNTINFLRNKERPLWFAFDKKHEQLFWSSERDHLVAAMIDIPHDDVKWLYPLPENDHYSWIIPDYGKAFGKPRVTKREGDKTTSFTHSTPIGLKSTQAYGDKAASASRFAWKNNKTQFWERFVQNGGVYIYSETENGKYYDTLQEAWDALPENEKVRRLDERICPVGINSGYSWSESSMSFVKLEPAKKTLHLVPGVGHNQVTMHDELKEKKLKEAVGEAKTYILHKEQNKRIYWDIDNKRYIVFTFEGMYRDPPWSRSEVTTCPSYVPFTKLDVNANHGFKHIGKGKKKVIYFRGFKNEMLVRQSFEKIMGCGCVNCKRKPEWGNTVTFLNSSMFMCEHCSRNENELRAWKEAVQEENKSPETEIRSIN